ncbi:U3 snoRNP-associated protein Nan1 [Schizosaccharomyces pombe]
MEGPNSMEVGSLEVKKNDKDPWSKTAYLGGRLVSKIPAVYSNDNKFVFLTYDTFIGIFSLITGDCINRIFFPNNLANLLPVAVLLSPENAFELYVIFQSGYVCVHDWSNSELLRTMEISTRVHAASFSGKLLFAVTDTPASDSASSQDRFTLYALSPSTSKEGSSILIPTFVSKFNEFLALDSSLRDNNLATVAVITTDKAIFSLNVPKKKRSQRWIHREHLFNMPQKLTNVALCGSACAVSDDEGKIHVINDISNEKFNPQILHWHANPLNGLSWALNGEYLLSGGQEGVLVLWQMETSHRQFLPRLGSSILSIATSHDSDSYALHLGDNSLVVIRAVDLAEQIHVSGINSFESKYLTSTGPKNTSKQLQGLVQFSSVSPNGELLLMSSSSFNGHSVSVQEYDLTKDSTIRKFEAARYSYSSVSKNSDDATSLDNGHVGSVAVTSSRNGLYIATIDTWCTNIIDEQQRNVKQTALKFWQFDSVQKTWVLMTRIDNPHGNLEVVTALKMMTSSNRFITVGTDATLRIWALLPGSSAWKCVAIHHFANTHSQASIKQRYGFSKALTCSLDDSIIGFGYGSCMHFINSETLEEISTVDLPHGGQLENAQFLNAEHCVIISQRRLLVWNVISASVQWTLASKFTGLLASSSSGNDFAVIDFNSSYSRLIIFSPDSPKIQSIHIFKTLPVALHYLHGGFVVLDNKSIIHVYAGDLTTKIPSAQLSIDNTSRSLLGDFQKRNVPLLNLENPISGSQGLHYKRLTTDMIHNLFNVPSNSPVNMQAIYNTFSKMAVGEPMESLGTQIATLNTE